MNWLTWLKNKLAPDEARTASLPPLPSPLSLPRPAPAPKAFLIPTLVIRYFPVNNGAIDRAVTGDVGAPLPQIRDHVERTTGQVVAALERGSSYHGYKDPTARPNLRYEIVETLEFLEPLPTHAKAGHRVPMTDYNAIQIPSQLP